MIEEYVIIKDFENYAISNTGKIKRITKAQHTYINKELHTSINNCGYKTVILRKDKNPYCKTIHRLVAEAFLEKPLDFDKIKYDVDHIDNDKSNNNINNLQWLTHKENCSKRNHSYTHSEETKKKMSEAHKSIIPFNKGKHKVWDNKKLNKYHYE